jgi:hypothetical protein
MRPDPITAVVQKKLAIGLGRDGERPFAAADGQSSAERCFLDLFGSR